MPDETVKKPFLKWAGRKTKLVHALKPLFPIAGQRYIEPFLGSGAVFLNTDYPEAVLSDNNEDVINLFVLLKTQGEVFVNRCEQLFTAHNNTPESFNHLRDDFNDSDDVEERAALFVYLNRHCYNGLCRYNREGEFNTPFGKYPKPYFPRPEMLEFARKLAGAELHSQDFRQSLAQANEGDIVYCDPPYVPLSGTANFKDYSPGGFSLEDQRELVTHCVQAAQRGAVVLVSNHDTPFTRELYNQAADVIPVLVSRTISCDGENRKKAKELIAVFKET